MLEALKKAFPECTVKEVIVGMFNVAKDAYSFVVVTKIDENQFFVLKRIDGGYGLAIVSALDLAIIEANKYFES
jgi:hypothetical protein